MKRHKISGFTILELTITTVMMAIIMVIAPVIILKRSVKPKTASKVENIAECTTKCIFSAREVTLKTSSGEQAKYDYNKNSGEFYTIELIGGSGGATNSKPGCEGERKTIYLPSLQSNEKVKSSDKDGILTGYYLMEAGIAGSSGQSGYPTTICSISAQSAASPISSISCNGNAVAIIARVGGGITTNEEDNTCDSSDGGKIIIK